MEPTGVGQYVNPGPYGRFTNCKDIHGVSPHRNSLIQTFYVGHITGRLNGIWDY